MGTEIDRLGGDTTLPLWSARALIEQPELVQDIHISYINSGAEVLTTNTFRTQERTLSAAGLDGRGEYLTKLAVQLAREAINMVSSPSTIRIAGSISPLEDCYSPQLVPDTAILEKEHQQMAQWLFEGGVDLYLVETMNTIREASVVVDIVETYGLPIWLSFTCGEDGKLLSGETWDEVLNIFVGRVDLLMVNCSSLQSTNKVVSMLSSREVTWGFYPNFGTIDDLKGWEAGSIEDSYLKSMKEWLDLKPSVIGTCCGATPEQTSQLRSLLDAQ
jgi:homocysteine S-methyltransferase